MSLHPSEKIRLLKLLQQRDRDKIPPILSPLWRPYRKKMIHGGRGSGKSESVVRINIRQASNYKQRIVWGRYIQDSIEESIYSLIALLIEYCKYPGWRIYDKKIVHKKTKSKFVFKGLRDIIAAGSMKSYAKFDKLIVEEAQQVPEDVWIIAVPTFRNKGSEIWAIFNWYEELDPVYKLYCMNPRLKTFVENGYQYRTDGDTLVIQCNFWDNPWFPDVLRKEMEIMREDDYDLYLHVWEDHPIAQLEKAIMDRILVDLAMKTILPADGPQVIGVDVARHGMDRTIAYEKRGSKVKKIMSVKNTEPIIMARELAHKADNPYIQFNIDNGGLGAGGMIDKLKKELGFKNVNEINFGGNAKNKKKYANVATEMYFECKDKLINADIPNDPILKQDLTGRLFGYDEKTRKKIEKKEKFRERYHRSPDDGDACVLCFYDPGKRIILKGNEKQNLMKKVKNRRLYNKRRFIV